MYQTVEDRPKWQQGRGPRYGNRRKELARLKVEERKKTKKRDKFQAFRRELDEV